MQALDALLNRVSVPRLVEPAPTPEQRELMFAAAMRAPDHGQLRPWRFLTVEGQARHRMGELLAEAARFNDPLVPETVVEKALNGPLRAPLVVVVIARLQDHFRNPQIRATAGGRLRSPWHLVGGVCPRGWRRVAHR